MTRKDFELIADVIRLRVSGHALAGRDREALALADVADDFAAELKRTNPRFDRERFLKACGVT